MAIAPIAPDITPETEQEWETRSQFRRDLITRLDELLIAAEHTVEGGPEDGVTVVTHKAWAEVLRAIAFAPLPAIDRHYAEVVTGANVTVWCVCPRCGIPAPILMHIDPELRVDTSSAELRLKAKAKPRSHLCGQLTIPAPGPEVEGQESLNLEEMIGPRCGKPIGGEEADEFCHLPEGHQGECAPAPAEEILEESPAEDATPAEALAKTPEQAAADVARKRSRRRNGTAPAADIADDDLLPGELRCEGSNHMPGCAHVGNPMWPGGSS
jgi:hypothetical protein